MKMNPKNIQDILDNGRFPVSAALERLEQLRYSLAIFSDKSLKNLLHCAAEMGDCESIKWILDNKILMVNCFTVRGQSRINEKTPLHFACENGHFEAVKLLVQYGADVNAGAGAYIPVIFAAVKGGKMEIFDFLASKGANIHATGALNRTCLSEAVREGQNDFIDRLIKMGFSPMIMTKLNGNLLHEAAMNPKYPTLWKLLQEFRFDPNEVDALQYRPVDYLFEKGDRATLDLYTRYGIDVMLTGPCLMTPLYLACESGNLETAQYLMERGMNPNTPNPYSDNFPLQIAVKNKNLAMYDLLVRFGANIHLTTKRGETLMSMAIKSNHPGIVERMVRIGANVNEMSAFSRTSALHTASCFSTAEVVHKMIDLGANVHAKDADGMTPLHKACIYNRPLIVFALIQRGANVNVEGQFGKLPLDLATEPAVIKILLENGGTRQTMASKFLHSCCCCFV